MCYYQVNIFTNKNNVLIFFSGESGAGKTVATKYIMNYIAKISGGGQRVQVI